MNLPTELLLLIIQRLDVISKLRLSHSNRFLRQLIASSQTVQIAHTWRSSLVVQFFTNCFYFEINIAHADPESICLVSGGIRISYLAKQGYMSINERMYRFAMPFKSGDTIGCGFYFNPPQMFFTKNGLWIGDAPFHLERHINYRKLWIPEIRGAGTYIINLAGPFEYDLATGAKHLQLRAAGPVCGELYNLNQVYFKSTAPTLDGNIVSFPSFEFDIARSIQICMPVCNDSYCRIEILKDAPNSFLSVGFAHYGYSPFHHIGWDWGSIGYHSDDGNIYHQTHTKGKQFHTPFKEGDIIGLGMQNSRVFFTLNGQFLHPLYFLDIDFPVFFSVACNSSWQIRIDCNAKLSKAERYSQNGLFLAPQT